MGEVEPQELPLGGVTEPQGTTRGNPTTGRNIEVVAGEFQGFPQEKRKPPLKLQEQALWPSPGTHSKAAREHVLKTR